MQIFFFGVIYLVAYFHLDYYICFNFFSLDFCFNSTTKIQNNQKLHSHKTSNFRFFEMFASNKICVSDTNFLCLVTVTITLPYVLAICCYYHDESKQALARTASELIIFFQTFNKQWPIFGKLDFISL